MVPRLCNFPSTYILFIPGDSIGVLFNGLLAEFSAILDSFFISTTRDYIGIINRGWWVATKW